MNKMATFVIRLWIVSVQTVLIGIAVTATAAGQTQGHPLIYDPPGLTTDAVVDAYVHTSSGTNICDKIYDAFNSAPGMAVTVDARGFTGDRSCPIGTQHQPFIPATSTGRLLLGNANIMTSFSWLVPMGVEIIGLGPLNTTVRAAGDLPAGPVIRMGNGNVQFGVKIKALTVNCANVVGCTGIKNEIAEEGSTVEDVIINNAPAAGLDIVLGTPGAANSGPYRNITVQYSSCGTCDSSTVGVKLTGGDYGNIVRGLDNITISGCSTVGISLVGASARIANSTISCSSSATGIQIGNGIDQTHNVQIENVRISGTGTGVHATTNSSNIVLINVNASSTVGNLLVDDEVVLGSGNNHALAAPFIGFYMRGDCCTLNGDDLVPPALATSVPTVPGQTPAVPIPWESPQGVLTQ